MTTRHNYSTNPACSVSVAGWGGGSTPTRNTSLTGFPDRTTGASYTSGTFMTGPTMPVSGGMALTLSIYARSNSFGASGNVYVEYNDASSVSTPYTMAFNTVTRLSISTTVPAGKTTAQIVIDGQNYTVNPGDYTEMLYEAVAAPDTYFDGDTTPGGAWDGTPGLSTSTLTTTPVGPRLLMDVQGELNRLAGTSGLGAAKAANVWAGTSGLDLVGALNAKAGTKGLGAAGAANHIAGTTGLDVAGALQKVAA